MIADFEFERAFSRSAQYHSPVDIHEEIMHSNSSQLQVALIQIGDDDYQEAAQLSKRSKDAVSAIISTDALVE